VREGEPWRVLLVEDDEDDWVLTRSLFAAARTGVAMAWARSRDEALALLATGTWDVVLVDYRLGEHSGIDLLREIVGGAVAPPVILLTGQGNPEVDVAAMEAGAAEYLIKSEITPALLERTVRYAIEGKRAAEALRRREERYRRLLDGLDQMVYECELGEDGEPIVTFASSRSREVQGVEPAELLGDAARWRGLVHPEDLPAALAERQRLVRDGERVVRRYRLRRCGATSWRWVEDTLLPRLDGAGRVAGFLGVVRDVHEGVEAEQALRRRDAILSAIAQVARRLLAAGDGEGRMPEVLAILGHASTVSRAYLFVNGQYADGRLVARQRWEWVLPGISPRLAHPDLQPLPYREAGYGRWQDELAAGQTIAGPVASLPVGEQPALRAQGIRSLVVVPIFVAGTFWGFLGLDDCEEERQWSAMEVEALHAAAGAIAAAIDRGLAANALHEREAQLKQAQRMEAVGRLAGGIAHDFNNLLTAISGYAELLLLRMPVGDSGRQDGEEILRAAERAAGLTRQLLAFSRRQVLQPRPVDINAAVRGTERLLRRLIGEDVRIRLELAPDLPAAVVDPGQIDQVLVNLAVNARDAMPGGGVLRIATGLRRLTASSDDLRRELPTPQGTFVELLVEDSGTGMPDEVRERIFEPFFTTKEAGRGTGLGLSTVYGIVEQSGGTILVDSAPGRGTRFSVLLPTAEQSGARGS
jgi:two-component system, cell cycle sensor histidine kinase and response regulator CckA